MSKTSTASSKLHDKHQLILADLLRDEDNKYCADCLAKGPRWASWNLGVFMCIRCAGIHRNLGVHISRVKSVNLDSWTPEQIESIQKGGNRHARNLYEANLPANFRRPQDDYAVEQFIRGKYVRKTYMVRGDVATSNKDHHTAQEQKVKSKIKKAAATTTPSQKSSSHSDQILSVSRPSYSRSPSPQPSKSAASSSTKTCSSSLIAMDSGLSPSSQRTATNSKKSSPQPVVDLLTGCTASSVSLPASNTASSSASTLTSQPSNVFVSAKGQFSSTASQGQSDLMFATEAQGHQPKQQAPLMASPASTKDSIMSLFNSKQQQQLSSYTAQGYPVNAYYYQQQQAASIHMAQMSAMQQHQVSQVTAQMQKIKMNQEGGIGSGVGPPFPPTMSNGLPSVQSDLSRTTGVGVEMMGGGQTLNPTLW